MEGGTERREQESENAKEQQTVTVRVRSPPERVFDAALDIKTEPAPLDWNIKSVPGKRNQIRMPCPPLSPTNRNNNSNKQVHVNLICKFKLYDTYADINN